MSMLKHKSDQNIIKHDRAAPERPHGGAGAAAQPFGDNMFDYVSLFFARLVGHYLVSGTWYLVPGNLVPGSKYLVPGNW